MKHASLSLINSQPRTDNKIFSSIVGRVIILVCCFNWLPAYAESPFLKKGIEAYTAGDYNKAAGQFGAAESAEFNNPVLHYYLANTLVHLNEREGAIREYRIAYALEPDGDVGRQCRLALSVYGADLFSQKTTKRSAKDPMAAFGKITFSSDPIIQQAVVAMHRQVDQLTSAYTNNNISPGNYGNGRGMSLLRRAYGWQNRQLVQDNARSASAASESANNLEKLLNNNAPRGTVKLDPVGTNLYIRKYNYADSANPTQTSTTVSGKLIIKPSIPASVNSH